MIVSSFVLNAFEDYEIRNSLEISASIFLCVAISIWLDLSEPIYFILMSPEAQYTIQKCMRLQVAKRTFKFFLSRPN